jgi:hypothetical protein
MAGLGWTKRSMREFFWEHSRIPAEQLRRAGGGHPTNSYWLQGYSPGVVGREIRLPEAFGRLLDEAEREVPA